MKVLPLEGRDDRHSTAVIRPRLEALLALCHERRLELRRSGIRLSACVGRLASLRRRMVWDRRRLRASRLRVQRALAGL
ncbi:MAG TPA: hypothetical protein VGA64_12260 [Candidatus Polarisedimenticolia bacterium]